MVGQNICIVTINQEGDSDDVIVSLTPPPPSSFSAADAAGLVTAHVAEWEGRASAFFSVLPREPYFTQPALVRKRVARTRHDPKYFLVFKVDNSRSC